MLSKIVLTTFSLLILTSHNHSQHFHDKAPMQQPYLPKVIYTIRAEVLSDSFKVKAQMELQYRNTSRDSLSEIYFHLDLNAFESGSYMEQRYLQVEDSSIYKLNVEERAYCKIDSFLYLGVPLKDERLIYDNTILRVHLPQKIAPQETGFFLLAFQSKLPYINLEKQGSLKITNWYPQVCAYRNGVWYNQPYLGWKKSLGEYALYNVELIIDSSYSIVHPGILINEKEHFGLLPKAKDDTIFIDITNPKRRASLGFTYQPLFDKGIKHYFIQAKNISDFSFVVIKDVHYDRIYIDNLLIEVCYNEKTKIDFSGFVASSAREMVNFLSEHLGPFPYDKLTIVAIDSPDWLTTSQPLVMLPGKIKDKKTLLAFLAVNITGCWFSPVLPASNEVEQFYDKGLAYYTAIMMLYNLHGIEGYKMLEKYKKWIKKKSPVIKLFRKDSKLFNPYKKPVKIENELIGDDIALLQKCPTYCFGKYPSEHYLLRFVIGDNQLWKAIRAYVQKFRSEYTYKNEFTRIVNEVTGEDLDWFFSQWDDESNIYDFSISILSTEKDNGFYSISYELRNNGSILVPVEIAFISGETDTVYDTLNYDRFAGSDSVWQFKISLEEKPEAIVVDPNHYILDNNRYNNYYFKMPIRYKYRDPENLFIGFKKF